MNEVAIERRSVQTEQWLVMRDSVAEFMQPTDPSVDLCTIGARRKCSMQCRPPQRHLMRG